MPGGCGHPVRIGSRLAEAASSEFTERPGLVQKVERMEEAPRLWSPPSQCMHTQIYKHCTHMHTHKHRHTRKQKVDSWRTHLKVDLWPPCAYTHRPPHACTRVHTEGLCTLSTLCLCCKPQRQMTLRVWYPRGMRWQMDGRGDLVVAQCG